MLTPKNIRAIRLQQQRLTATELKTPAEVVRWFGAVQAQDYPAAKWALGQRIMGGNEKMLDDAFDQGALLRTHVMRPTWHFVTPEDIRWLLKLTAARIRKLTAHSFREVELDSATLRKSEKVLARVLRNEHFMTRNEIRTALVAAKVEPGDGRRLGYMLFSAELSGLVCSGGRKGKQFTYALLDERAPETPDLTREESIRELTRRYFRSHGPATISDFAWWSWLTKTDARSGIEMLQDELTYEQCDGKEFWYVSDTIREPSLAHLLSPYDEYLIAYTDRSAALERVTTDRSPLFGPTVALDGNLVGTWSRAFTKSSGKVVVNIHTRLRRQDWKAIEQAVERYSEFIGCECRLERKHLS